MTGMTSAEEWGLAGIMVGLALVGFGSASILVAFAGLCAGAGCGPSPVAVAFAAMLIGVGVALLVGGTLQFRVQARANSR